MAALLRIFARYPVVSFMVISLAAGFLTAAIPSIVESKILPFDLPMDGFLGRVLGVGIAAFLVTAALGGGTALLILPTVVCAGACRCGGIWSRCSPCRSERH